MNELILDQQSTFIYEAIRLYINDMCVYDKTFHQVTTFSHGLRIKDDGRTYGRRIKSYVLCEALWVEISYLVEFRLSIPVMPPQFNYYLTNKRVKDKVTQCQLIFYTCIYASSFYKETLHNVMCVNIASEDFKRVFYNTSVNDLLIIVGALRFLYVKWKEDKENKHKDRHVCVKRIIIN